MDHHVTTTSCDVTDPPISEEGQDRDNTIKVAICGKPNSGKSSLFNALVGEDRSIVSHIEGSTTDAVDAYLEAYNGRRGLQFEDRRNSLHRTMKHASWLVLPIQLRPMC
ncbi:unnamed protein product [Durusdinium trenchii]|uniref:G domain-containing protein n=1 Tax=Durusdinium trenchii TaxID=1381693 RepID=A0ABP0SPX0_9DINO